MRYFFAFALLLGVALGQSRDVVVNLGFSGELAPDAWNPVRLSLRDQPPVTFTLELDHGGLAEGPRLVRYTRELPGGSGLRVYEDDLYLPAWRSLNWTVRSGEAILASGTLGRMHPDTGPLQLVVAGRLGARQDLLSPDLRVIDLLPAELPERISAYDGVAALVIDPSAAAPRAEALVSAAAAGAVVILLEPLPPSHEALARLAPDRMQRLGAGWVVRGAPEALAALPAGMGLDTADLTHALLTADLLQGPPVVPVFTIFLLTAGYSLLVLLFMRYGGVPGVLAGLALGVMLSIAVWNYLRPEEMGAPRERTLVLGGGALAWRQNVSAYFSLSEGARRFDGGRALDLSEWQVDDRGLTVQLGRWQSTAVASRPALQPAGLRWQEGRLQNSSNVPLHDLFVIGLGSQPGVLEPGSSLAPRPAAPPDLPEVYYPLLPLLPEGSALARQGDTIYAALPPASEERP